MIKVIILTLLLTTLPILLYPTPVSAHILATDGSIGAVLHTDPDDDPIAGIKTGLYFAFKDKQNKFQPAICNCTFYVYEGGQMIYYNILLSDTPNPTLDNIAVFYTFPKKDVYQVIVSGTPQTTGAFQSFSLKYDIRVARDQVPANIAASVPSSSQNWFSFHLIHIIGIGIISLFLVGALIWQSLAKNKLNGTK